MLVGARGASWFDPGPAPASGEHNTKTRRPAVNQRVNLTRWGAVGCSWFAGVRPRRRRCCGCCALRDRPAAGGRGVFILLDKVWGSF
nr:MAG TPA: hypothetical protein [Caudoviricetes sp.]